MIAAGLSPPKKHGERRKDVEYRRSLGGDWPNPLKGVRGASGYRDYGVRDVHTLPFIRPARDLGFPIESIQTLLALWHERGRPSAEMKALP